MTIISKLANKDATIGIVGLGYVGLPLGLGFTAKKYKVLGLDIDQKKVDLINQGVSYIEHIDESTIKDAVNSGLLTASADFSEAVSCDALILCVPTPLNRHHEPDLSYVVNTIDSLLPHLKKGQALSLESTTYPGTTEEILRPKIEAKGFTIGEDIYLLYSPEREDPGNMQFSAVNTPKVMGGATKACQEVGVALYNAVVEEVVPVSSTKVAEFSKLLENIYRSVNIGLVNELKIAADRMGIDIWEVIEAAKTKPFGFKAFYPGPGLGGHCIPIDPFYLTWKAKEYGVHTRFIELAGEINESMPSYVVQKVGVALNSKAKPINGSKVLLMGLAYKEDVDDMRESPSFHLMDGLSELGAKVDFYDPHIPIIPPTREHAEWTGCQSVEWTSEVVSSYDCVVIATNHSRFNLKELVEFADLIVDTRNALSTSEIEFREDKVFKA